jgi:hypothetical protein
MPLSFQEFKKRMNKAAQRVKAGGVYVKDAVEANFGDIVDLSADFLSSASVRHSWLHVCVTFQSCVCA